MDGARGTLLPIAAGFRLRGTQAHVVGVSFREEVGEGASRRTRVETRHWK